MIGAKEKPQLPASPCESAQERCALLEQQLAETHAQRQVAFKAVEDAQSVERHARARSEVDFLEVRSRALIQQRLELEEARLVESAREARAAADADSEKTGEAGRRVAQLERELEEAERERNRLSYRARESFRLRVEADNAVARFRSANVADQGRLRTYLAEPTRRLETLGT